tara:strand:- start:518 stop:700 length:183 start_codon:yes stop_codon:yes gene_type:complete
MQTKPELVLTTPKGGTIHTYPLTGGKKTFEKYLSCYIGHCEFFNNIEDATNHLIEIEPRS